MNRLKISTRLAILIGILSLVMAAIAGLGLYGISKSDDALGAVYRDRAVPLGQLAAINRLNLRNRLAIAGGLLYPEEIVQNTADVERNLAEAIKIWADYVADGLTPNEAKLAKQLADDRKRFEEEGIRPAAAALLAHDTEAAKTLIQDKIRPLYVPVGAGLDALIQLQLDVAESEYKAAVVRYNTIRIVVLGAILVGLAFSVLFGVMVVRGITAQLGAEPAGVLEVTTAISGGNLSSAIFVKPGDDSSVMAGMASMQISLQSLVSNVRQGAESVSTASAEIAQGNIDLSGRTEQQAAALEETAASMEQLSATVQQNADNAKQATQMALQATIIAAAGGEVVGQVVETMKDINESSRRISDIIAVIEGIAFQTNILALNAAVEAARAGDQGRGFAVVATEVRSLAGRSAEAAKEIKSLINASVERVERGTEQIDQAGVTMSEVVTSIQRVNDIMGEISAASAEQAAGVAQVGEAMTHMDQATQQNAALVEEMAAAASSLSNQSTDLVQLVSSFNTGAKPATPAFKSAPPVRKPSLTAAYQGAERRSAEFNSTDGLQAHSKATRVIQGVKVLSAKPAATQKLLMAKAKDEADWETF